MVPLSSNPCSVAPSTLAHAARMPHSARAAAVRTPMPTTRARQAYAHPPRFLRPGAHPLPPRPTETLQCRSRRGLALTPPAQTLRTPQCTPPVTALPGPRTPLSSGGHTGCRSEGCFWARYWYRQALHRVQCRGPRCLRRGERLIVLHRLHVSRAEVSSLLFHCFVFLTGHTVR